MLIRLSGMLAAVTLVAACHGSGQSSIPDPMGNPGMYFRATPPLSPSQLSPSHMTVRRQCAEAPRAAASCTTDPAR
jgi:hypothetical protein